MAPAKTSTSGKKLVIVESPSKVSKIASYLGDGYVVDSSRGHVRDLPSGGSEVPAKYKGTPWARTGVNVEDDFTPIYVVSADKKPTIKQLKDELADADELLLATDGDREGEAIAWHLMEALKPTVPVRRMVFHEITRSAIEEAVTNLRELDRDLVDAQETRRILDRLYGYEISPVLWRKVMSGLSAGRVQSVATRLVVDRERERMAFVSAGYFDLEASLDAGADASPRTVTARLTHLGESRIAQGRDFDATGQLAGKDAATLVRLDESAATAAAAALRSAQWQVRRVEAKPYRRRPYEPFRTTTLQQEAGRKLGFTSQRAMSVAQDLYEQGHITYMRTDSITLSSSAISAARDSVSQLFGSEYLPDKPRVYASKVKNAQEAHEAIRPAGEQFATPAQTGLRGDHFRLYELIWKRTVASQMTDAVGESVSITLDATTATPMEATVPATGEVITTSAATAVASGRTITFHGFLKAYVESLDDDSAQSDDAQSRLPALTEGQSLTAEDVTAAGHETRPPARYTEPTLVAKLEELEIGRPSTYSSIIRTITSRDYVFKKGSALVPTWLAFSVTRLLEEHFGTLVDYAFTAQMEQTLDHVARGDTERLGVLKDFWFGAGDSAGLEQLTRELGEIDARALATFPLADGSSGIVARVGRYGTYVEDADGNRASVADDLPPDELTVEKARDLLAHPMGEERELGRDPESLLPIVVRTGRFGPYVTEVLGEDAPKGAKPRTGSLLKSMTPEGVTLEQALQLLSLPRLVGHAEDGTEITTQNGRYGPYLKKGTDSRSLTSEDQIFDLTLEEALAILAQPKQRGRAAAKPPLRTLGEDPVSGAPMVIKEGRFGPYVTDGETNASLRRGDDPAEVTDERASELLAERRAKGPTKKKTTRKKATTAKKAPTKKAPAKKATTKKTTTTKAATKKTTATKAATTTTKSTESS